MKFTKSQKEAIETKNKNLTLSAGAGSGKTTVLVNRYISFLASKSVNIKEILAITFTNKSAADMRVKVREHISKQIKSSFGKNKKYWLNIKDQFEQATISTIHGFALQVLRSHPLESNINPEASMMDEVESKILLTDTIREIVREYYQDEDMQSLVQTVKSVNYTIQLLASIYQKVRSLGQPIENIASKALSQVGQLDNEINTAKMNIKLLFKELNQVVDNYNKTSVFTTRYQNYDIEDIVNKIMNVKSYQDSGFNLVLKDIKAILNRPVKDAKELSQEIKENIKTIKQVLAFLDTLPLYDLLERIFVEIDEKYSNRKRMQRVLDYSDLEWGLLKILRENKNVRTYYQNKYKYILVDEFQDTSPLQQELIKLLSPYKKNGLFIVGDQRQSIYRFRAAELAGFLEMKDEIVDNNGKALYLAENFRSKPNLIKFQNEFFSYLFNHSELNYQEVIPGLNEPDNQKRVKLWYLHKDEITDEMKINDLRQLEAKFIAKNIYKLNKQGVSFQDIAVLFRAMTNVKMYELELQKLNIPYQVTGSKGLFDKQEIIDILNLMKHFADTSNEVNLFGLLRSPFFSFSDEELYRIRNEKGLDQELNKKANEKYHEVVNELKSWNQKLVVESVSDCLEEFISLKNYKASLLMANDYGKQAVANINKLIALIRSLESNNTSSLSDILNYINVMRQGNALMGEAKVSEETNSVQIMSVHQSKGLEFDTVIIPQMDRKLANSPKDMICYTKEHGLAIRTRGYADNTQTNFYFEDMKEKEIYLDLEESFRLFYVATTRAERSLILSTASIKISNSKKSYLDYFADYLGVDELPDELTSIGEVIELIPQRIEEVQKEVVKSNKKEMPKLNLLKKVDYKSNTNLFLSATALMIHHECPKQYYYRYIKNIPEFRGKATKGYSATELGTVIHKVCEVMTENNGYEILEKLLTRINKEDKIISMYRRNGRSMIDNYLKSKVFGLMKKADEVKSELEFNLAISDKILTGVIDKFIINNRNYVLMDLKTGIINTKQLEKYKLQNAVYALAITQAYDQYPSSLINYYMSNSEIYDYIGELPDYDSSFNLIKDRLKALDYDLASKSFEKNLESCRNCAYLDLCKNNKGDNNA